MAAAAGAGCWRFDAAMDDVWCTRGHRLLRADVEGCQAHGEHRVFVCPMRLGARRCGLVVVTPPYDDACWDDRE